MDVSIIIVNYNTCELLKQCLFSIFEKNFELRFEVIVVDNASTDKSKIMLKKHFPSVKLIESDENLGFGKANNLGVKFAFGKYLFLLNTDILLINNSTKILFNFMEKHPDVGICGGNLYHNDGKPNFSYSKFFPSLFSIFCYRFRLISILPNMKENFNFSNHYKEVAIIIGADCFIKKSLFDELDGFDPEYFMYIEDCDLCFRTKHKGYKIVSVPEAKIVHLQGKSSNTEQKYLMEIKSHIIFLKKFHHSNYVFFYLIIEFLYCTLKLLIFIVFFKMRRIKGSYLTFKVILKKLLSN